MEELRIGRIRVIPGENGSRFPSCTSLVVEDDVRTIIDTGCGEAAIRRLLDEGPIDRVINTHFHFDHICGNYLLPGAEVWLNHREAPCFKELVNVARLLGIVELDGEEAGERWAEEVAEGSVTTAKPTPYRDVRWYLSTRRLDNTYRWGDEIEFGHTKAKVLSAPGHSLGNSFLFFPEERLVYIGDVDMTAFGPWYGGTDGDIDAFITSAVSLVDLEADHFVTGHEKGILTLEEFMDSLGEYLEVIDRRDEIITRGIEKGLSVEEMVSPGFCYPPESHSDPWAYIWDKMTVRKHVRRMVSTGAIELDMERSSELLKDTEPLPLIGYGFELTIDPEPDNGEIDILLDG